MKKSLMVALGAVMVAAPALAQEEPVVNVYNWSDYIADDTVAKFEAETGIKVNYDVFDSNEVLETKLLAGNTGYDVVVPSASFMERQIKAGVFRKLDRSKLTNWGNLDPEVLQRVALHDPGNEHAVNHMWGTDGIGYNEGKIKASISRRCIGRNIGYECLPTIGRDNIESAISVERLMCAILSQIGEYMASAGIREITKYS